MRAKLARAMSVVDQEVQELKEDIKDQPEVLSKRRRLREKIGRKLRELSPTRPPSPENKFPLGAVGTYILGVTFCSFFSVSRVMRH
jgi:hypothetical protein